MTGIPQHVLQVGPEHLSLNRHRDRQSPKYFEPIALISIPALHHKHKISHAFLNIMGVATSRIVEEDIDLLVEDADEAGSNCVY